MSEPTTAPTGGATIRLESVSKTYPGQATPAIEEISMTIAAGEIVVLVGPSGCGKTTTMKMINRLIEPSSGRILIDDTNVLELDPDELRRKIGYVIQQIGLFPHMRVAENIALVPQMLGWQKNRIQARVAELLDLVGLPDEFGRRYPRELSGGQQQRVGVARALAADPPVMLMDEPFGATDPITRDRLQNEFLRLQAEIGKTIVFVTHDFDEALKMGDRIAVLRPRSVIAQFDTPGAILAAPADDYVANFIGSGGHIKRLALISLGEVELLAAQPQTRHPAAAPTIAIGPAATLRDALDLMLGADVEQLAVTDDGTPQGRFVGTATMDTLFSAVHRPNGAAHG